MIIKLERFSLGINETEGILQVGFKRYATIEQPWRQNKVGMSCVPLGVYSILPYKSPTFGPTYGLHNPELGVSLSPTLGVSRSLILFHPANWAKQLKGCIAPGMRRSFDTAGPMVLSSKKAMSEILAFFNESPNLQLEITQKGY